MSTGSPTGSPTSNPPSTDKLSLPSSCDPPTEQNPHKQAVWLVFGATGHLGRSLVKAAYEHGDQVMAVGREHESDRAEVTGWHENCHGTLCDVRVRESVDAAIKETITRWGRIDIIANCTGYGVVAAAEDQTSSDVQNQFSTNFFGTLNIISLSLPYFRTNKIPGRYLIFSSTAGALGLPGLAPYCATKYAVEGLIESMLYEVDSFGIKATLVEPGHVRLDDAAAYADAARPAEPPETARPRSGSTSKRGVPTRFGHFHIHAHPSPPYDTPTSPAAHAKRTFVWFDKRQPTSAYKSAELIWQLGHCSYPPLRLLLGNYAVESVRDRLRCVIEEIEEWRWLNFSEDGGGGEGVDVKQEGDDESMRDDGGGEQDADVEDE